MVRTARRRGKGRVVAEEHFTVRFEGPAIASGRMDVSDFAPSLIALAAALQRAHELLHPGEPHPKLTVNATRSGSFGIELVLIDHLPGMWERIKDVLNSDDAVAAATLSQFLAAFWGGVALLRNLYWRQQETPDGEAPHQTPGITIHGGVSIGELNVFTNDEDFRKRVQDWVLPLAKEGIDDLDVERDGEPVLELTKADLPAFTVPAPLDDEDGTTESTREVTLRLHRVSFDPGAKWSVSEGDKPSFWVFVADQTFLREVRANVRSFRGGDRLHVELMTVRRTSDGHIVHHTILRVLDQITGPEQDPLPDL